MFQQHNLSGRTRPHAEAVHLPTRGSSPIHLGGILPKQLECENQEVCHNLQCVCHTHTQKTIFPLKMLKEDAKADEAVYHNFIVFLLCIFNERKEILKSILKATLYLLSALFPVYTDKFFLMNVTNGEWQ